MHRDLTEAEVRFFQQALISGLPGEGWERVPRAHFDLARPTAAPGEVCSVTLWKGLWWVARQEGEATESRRWPTGDGWRVVLVAAVLEEVSREIPA